MNLSELLGGGIALWVSGQPVEQFAVVKSPADGQPYIRMTASGSGATDPSADTTNYRPFGGRPSKPMQRGEILIPAASLTATASISSVNTAKASLVKLGNTGNGGNTADDLARIALTNATTITATRSAFSGDVRVSWELEEKY